MSTNLLFNTEARKKLIAGIEAVANAVKVTLGPSGRNVIISGRLGGPPKSTKDGVTVAKSIYKLADPIEDMGARLIIEVARKTAIDAGDGTTTATILTQSMIQKGVAACAEGANPIDVKKGIDLAVLCVVDRLKKITKDIKDKPEAITQIATISANNDHEIGKIISDAVQAVGNDGLITVGTSQTADTYHKLVEGIEVSKGFVSPYFINNPAKNCVDLINPLILIYDKKMSLLGDVHTALAIAVKERRHLLIIADDIDGEALQTLIVNSIQKRKDGMAICAIRTPGIGSSRAQILGDIAVLTGGEVLSDDAGHKLSNVGIANMGSAEKIVVTKDTTTIIGGNGEKSKIMHRINQIKGQIESTVNDFEKEELTKRLARVSGGVAVLYVGANSELELGEKKDRVDDALRATKCAVEEGVVPGGGCAYLRCIQPLALLSGDNPDQQRGINIVRDTLTAPIRQICDNGGLQSESIIDDILMGSDKVDYGYNAKSNGFEMLFETGVIDPTKVARVALENAGSLAGTFILTECVINNEQQ